MEPHENQHCLQDPFAGYFSSLLSQEHKVPHSEHVLNEVENEDELQSHFQHQWRSGNNLFSNSYAHYNDYSNVVPSLHMSPSDFCSSLVTSSLDLNLQVAADIFANPNYHGVSSSNSIHHAMGRPQESPQNSSNSNIKLSSENGGGMTKKPGKFSDTKYSHHSEPKKLRTMPRSSFPPLKVRKEKLGDRIAALQRLVAPYGKTDTASVLTEAIGYIQFLHHQIQTLSVPYMESSNTKTATVMQDLSGKIQSKRDLRSRGLSLVPVSYASCFNTYN